ncbi:MAG: PEP-utilizing enzyme [Thermodesulfobacteriota bacterium]|jgi:pyruvate,water dikinase|nr:MAG: PEP-utilizing enzyme [Thermodesulfobacteriota bacterium]
MISLFNIFKPRKRSKPIDREIFRQRFENYQEILKANRDALELMADTQQKLSGNYLFDRNYLFTTTSLLESSVQKIVEQLNLLADQPYKGLNEALKKIMALIKKELQKPQVIQPYPFTIPFREIKRNTVAAVGEKCANLGEIQNVVGLPVPPGFAISTYAFQTFMQKNSLQERINEMLEKLDVKTMHDLEEASNHIQTLIKETPLPEEIAKSIAEAYEGLVSQQGARLPVAVRSSGAKEDSPLASFAGQYKSFLNVPGDMIEKCYKLVLTSQFSPHSIYYFKSRGFDYSEIPMAVGVMAMVSVESAGIVYTRHPEFPQEDFLIINAVFGLGISAVGGETTPDLYRVSRKDPKNILSQERGKQENMVISASAGTVAHVIVPPEKKTQQVLTASQITELSTLSLELEKKFGCPQDIEWAIDQARNIFILQARPLKLRQHDHSPKTSIPTMVKTNSPVLAESGTIASMGIGSGPVYLVKSFEDLQHFPTGAVLVSHHAPPDYTLVVDRASAIVTEVGSAASHIATVAREFMVPALFNVSGITEVVTPGETITVDAINGFIYQGIAQELLDSYQETSSPFKDTAIYQLLKKINQYVTPLNLTDPRAQDFKPECCKTLHDITRFSHEMAMQEMFTLGERSSFPEGTTKKLNIPQPLDVYLIDLGKGLNEAKSLSSGVTPDDVKSRPFLALWKGMSQVTWAGPRPVSLRGFMSVVARSASDPTVMEKLTYKNYVIITDTYMNFSTRLGYHFSSIDAFIGENTQDNYVQFIFNGGGADLTRRMRRTRLISMILNHHGLNTILKEDNLYARGENLEAATIEKMLTVLGIVVVTTRQMDMAMYNDKIVDWYFQEFIKGNYFFGATSQK